MSATLIKKISPRHIFGEKPETPKTKTDLYTVLGIASGVKTGETAYGPWTKLTGHFEATRVDTGEVFASGEVFLPEPMQSMIAAQLQQRDNDGKRVTESVQFSVMVSIKPSSAPVGYEYEARSLVESGGADPLAALRDQTTAALEAPKAKQRKAG